jgi:hypothetical protein
MARAADQQELPFREQPWTERVKRLGDDAELRYEEDRRNRGVRFTEYGVRRPPFTGREMFQLPNSVRYGPDYIESWGGYLRFVEVQGIGDNGVLRLKDEKLATLQAHDLDLPCWLWIWYEVAKRFICVPLSYVGPLILTARLEGHKGVYDERSRNPKPYTWVSWDTLTANATTHRIAQSRRAAEMGARVD